MTRDLLHRLGRTARSCVRTCALATPLLAVAPLPLQAASPIVIGQSLPSGTGSYRATITLNKGVVAAVGWVNQRGGINGRPLQLVTLDGGQDPAMHAANVRALVREHKAVAIVGCAGDDVCQATATAAAEMRVPLVGALSGAAAMSRGSNPWVFTLRPPYAREAEALAKQLTGVGISRTVLLTDGGANGERALALRRALESVGIGVSLSTLRWDDPASLDGSLQQVNNGNFQAAVMDLLPDTIDALGERQKTLPTKWPQMVVSPASSALQGIGNMFPNRVIGYSQVVPNPDGDSLPLTVEMQRSAELYSSGRALNFDGMAAYIAGKVTALAMRRAGSRVDGDSVAAALAAMDAVDLGGYKVSFSRGRRTGSDWVGIGMRTRDGIYLK